VSTLTPFAIFALALVGAAGVWALEQATAGVVPDPRRALGGLRRLLAAPLQHPESYDAVLFHLAPPLLFLASLIALATVPWAPGFRGIDFSAGALLFAAAIAYVTPGLFMAGWGAGRPLAVVGGFRWIALMLAYAMPLAMVITAVAAPAGSLRPTDIVEVQHAVPMAVVQPLALVLWLPAVAAACFMAPFDVADSDAELAGGVFGEYRGLDRFLVKSAQRVLLLAVSGMTAALFLAGWHWPLLPPAVWMGLKTLAVATLILWAGRRLVRVEVDRALSLAWKVANPLAILAIVIAGGLTLVFYR
jgi:NADH-quinone oxidoreductase subunit H